MFLLLREDASSADFDEIVNITKTVADVSRELAVEALRREVVLAAKRAAEARVSRDPS
jgi:hypothetical protein